MLMLSIRIVSHRSEEPVYQLHLVISFFAAAFRRKARACVSVPGAGRWSSRNLRTLPVAMPRTRVLSVCGCDSPSSGPSAAHSATSRCSSAFSASRPLNRPCSCTQDRNPSNYFLPLAALSP